MALALSASLAQSKVETELEARDALKALWVEEHEAIDPPKAEAPPEVILPQLCLPDRVTTKPRKGASRAKTTLEVRTDAERERQISEHVVLILSNENRSTSAGFRSELFKTGKRPFGSPKRTLICKNWDRSREMWTVNGLDKGRFSCDFMSK